MTEPVKGAKKLSSANSPVNAISFLVERMLAGTLNTCTLVRVDEVDKAACSVVVTPLVPQIDGEGNTLPPQPIYDVPYSRVQGGSAALIIDPEQGDIGIAVFAQRDISTVKLTKSAGQPGSLRTFDQGDALYVGWVLNKAPTVFLELTQDGKVKMVAPAGVDIDGDLRVSGKIDATGDVVGAGKSLSTHTHLSAAPGDPTSGPQ